MTVAEIKEYIDDRIKYYTDLELRKMGERGYYPFFKQKIVQELFNIKSMLDELEPKAKWEEQEYYKGYTAHQKANICSKCGFETIEKTKYCSSCGARMNDELEENNK